MLFIHPLADRHFGSFPFLAVVNNAATDIENTFCCILLGTDLGIELLVQHSTF